MANGTSARRWEARFGAWLAWGSLALAGTVMPVAAQPARANSTSPPDQLAHEETPESLFVNFLHYARLGVFSTADAYGKALLNHPDLDPVAVMEVANRDPKAIDTILILVRHSTIGDTAVRVLELIERGEFEMRKDPARIRRNIANLGGTPQQEYFAVRHLARSGEYAIPQMLQALQNPERAELRPRIIRALPKIGKAAVNPLVIALQIEDDAIRLAIIEALGRIGYPQAIPYLQQVMRDPEMPQESKSAAARAIDAIEAFNGRTFPGEAQVRFVGLAERYYDEDPAVRADPALDQANVWYWDDVEQILTPVVVPTRIFGPVMAMRCCEEALSLDSDLAHAVSLWLAANIRREARLGLSIESGDPDERGEPDATRPEDFPRALYFTQTAGPRYAHAVVARAVEDGDAPVALGAIRALHLTAGPSSLVGSEDYKQPLVQALQFPDSLVRIRAALALGLALPRSQFAGSQYVVPVLSDTLSLTGKEQILVVDADAPNLNRVVSALRGADRDVIGETDFLRGLDRARVEFQSVGAVFVSSDIDDPSLAQAVSALRSEFTFAQTPLVVLEKPGQSVTAEQIARSDAYADRVEAAADEAALNASLDRLREQTGKNVITPETALDLAVESASALRRIAVDGRTVFDLGRAEPALIAALSSAHEQLQVLSASVLALLPTSTAQRAVAHVALEAGNTDSLRLAAFDALAESAKNHGNHLEEQQVDELVRTAQEEADLTLRTAASQALGAVNLSSNKASRIIRSFHRG